MICRALASASLFSIAAAAHAQAPAAPNPSGPATATATAPADDTGNDIIITARRFEERLQDVPISVSAVTGTDLQRQGLSSFREIATKVAGFNFETTTVLNPQASIRGQQNLRTDSPVNNVAFYLDGIYLQRAYLIDQRLIELARVEVIKGPQSALYGRNAFAGAVNMVTPTPSLSEASGRVGGTIGIDERYEGRGYVSLPVVPGKLAVAFGGAYSTFDGTWENQHPLANADGATTKGNLGGYENWAAQGRISWKPVETVTVDLMWIHTDRREEAQPTYTVGTSSVLSPFNSLNASPRANLTPPFAVQNRLFVGELTAQPIIAAGDTTRPRGLVIDPRSFGLRGPTDIGSARVEFAPDDGPFESVAYQFGYTRAKVFGSGSPSPNPLSPVVVQLAPTLPATNYGTIFDQSGTDSSFRGHSHDLKFTIRGSEMFDAFFGFSYSNTKDIASNATGFAPTNTLTPIDPGLLFPIGPGLPFPSNLFQRSGYLQRNENIFSGYAFVKWSPNEQLEITAEGRYTTEYQRAFDLLTREPTNAAVQALVPPRFAQTINYFTPRGTISYKFTRDNLLYASAARGVKAGGLNGNTPFAGQRAYASETNWTYEIGTKNSFMDNAVTLNLAAFYTDWKDLQTSVVRLAANGSAPSFFAIVPSTVGNIGGVHVWGAEGDLTVRLSREFRLFASASYNRARYTQGSVSQRFGASGNCDGVVCATVPGVPTAVLPVGRNQVERVPDFNGVAGFTFDTTVGGDMGFYVRGDVTYKSKQFVDEANLAFTPGRTLVNGSVGLSFGNIDLTLWARNLFDQKYVTSSLFLIGTNGALSASYVPVLGERRTVGLTGNIKF